MLLNWWGGGGGGGGWGGGGVGGGKWKTRVSAAFVSSPFLPSRILEISSFTLKKQPAPSRQAVSFKRGMPSELTWVQFSKHSKSKSSQHISHLFYFANHTQQKMVFES